MKNRHRVTEKNHKKEFSLLKICALDGLLKVNFRHIFLAEIVSHEQQKKNNNDFLLRDVVINIVFFFTLSLQKH